MHVGRSVAKYVRLYRSVLARLTYLMDVSSAGRFRGMRSSDCAGVGDPRTTCFRRSFCVAAARLRRWSGLSFRWLTPPAKLCRRCAALERPGFSSPWLTRVARTLLRHDVFHHATLTRKVSVCAAQEANPFVDRDGWLRPRSSSGVAGVEVATATEPPDASRTALRKNDCVCGL